MNKRLNMLLIIVLSSLIVAKPMSTYAKEDILVSEEVKEAIISTLNDIESHKEDFFGKAEIEFEELQIGSCVIGYEYVGNEYREIIDYYPLFYINELIGFASSLDGNHYQLETKLAEIIRDKNVRKCAFIYTADGCYLYDGICINSLMSYDSPINTRSCLSGRIDNTGIMLCDLLQKEDLGYVRKPVARIQTYYSCNVSYVTQLPNELICWAATTATISNYLKGTNYTAEQIARAYYGEDFNRIVNTTTLASIMRNIYGLDYTYQPILTSSTVIYNNIVSGYPVAGNCIYRNSNNEVVGGHSITIYGINIISGYIVLMEPSAGSITVYGSVTDDYEYSYWSSYFGLRMELETGICHSWGG